nr:hypothetical protein [Tanacetum cinerariifolium]
MVKMVSHEAFACRCAKENVVLRQSYKPESCGAPSTPSYSAGPSTPPSYSSGPSTPPNYSSGPSTPTNYSLGSSRNAECSNCKHLRGKISVLKQNMKVSGSRSAAKKVELKSYTCDINHDDGPNQYFRILLPRVTEVIGIEDKEVTRYLSKSGCVTHKSARNIDARSKEENGIRPCSCASWNIIKETSESSICKKQGATRDWENYRNNDVEMLDGHPIPPDEGDTAILPKCDESDLVVVFGA